jgi:N-acetylmuramoyl-L-alanine amidase
MMNIIRNIFTSPNYSSRKGTKIDLLVIHHTGGKYPSDVNWLCDKKSKVSAHYYIRKNGEIYGLVPDEYCAWHAGESSFDLDGDGKIVQGEKWFNNRSIGIEMELLNIEDNYTDDELQSNFALSLDLVKKYNISTEQVLGHKEISPKRKIDPANFNMNTFRILLYGKLHEIDVSKIERIPIKIDGKEFEKLI